jgi:DNA-binding MarR family transcriptional regulator
MLESFFALGSQDIAVIAAALVELRRGTARPEEELSVRALAHLAGAGRRGASQRGTARALGMSEAALSRLVDQLEADGLAERRGHPNDRRIKMLHLTAAGEDQLKLCAHSTYDRTAAALAAFSATERDLLLRLVNRLAACGSPQRPCAGCRVGGC